MRDLVARVRAGRFRSSEIADPTITVSSLGERGVEALYGVIYPPQVAIVGFGKIVERPWVIGEGRGRAPGRHHDARRRPPRQRRTPGRAVPGQDWRSAAKTGGVMSSTDIRAVVKDELGRIAPEIDFDAIDPKARPARASSTSTRWTSSTW